MLFDTHCHLNSEELYPSIDRYLENAKNAGVGLFLVVGWNIESSKLAIKIANKYKNVYAAIGIHPCDIDDVSDGDLDELFSNFSNPKVVALGEIGLDYHWAKDPEQRNKQKAYFIKQIEFANKYNKPISVHNRDAFGDCLEILKSHKPNCGGIMHCYSGSVESLKDTIGCGLLVSFGGPLTFTNAKTPKEVCEFIPLDTLILETDCPYLSPHPLRGTTNEPANIKLIAEEVSKIKNIPVDLVEEVTTNNALKLLGINL